MRVRPATPDDAPAIAAHEAVAAAAPWSEQAVRATLSAHAGASVLAEVDGAVVGHLLGSVVLDEAELLTVAVHPLHRRHGVARTLLEAAQARWTDAGARVAWLEVREDNVAARALYASLGWEEATTRRAYYRDGATAWVLRRALT